KESKRKRAEPVHPPRKQTWWKQDLAIVLFFSLLLVTVGWILGHAPHRAHARTHSPRSEAQFGPTITNSAPGPEIVPVGMAWIPGGEFSMGANDPPDMDDVGMKATWDARPIHRVYVDGFFMDKTDVTNAQFAEFVKATGYVTIAE